MRALGVVAAVLICGCEPAPELTTAGLELRSLTSCPVRPEGELRLRAAGDFETRELSISSTRTEVGNFPADTRWLSLEVAGARGPAGALVPIGAPGSVRPALMLPLGESCPLGDVLVALPPDAAATGLGDGALLIAGGSDRDGAALQLVRLLPAGESFGQQVEGGMLLRRAGASATAIEGRVVVAGGAPDRQGPAHDTYEVFDALTARFDPALSARLVSERRDHGAVALLDGRLLLVGGRPASDAAPLASAEWIGLEGGDAVALEATLSRARAQPELLVLATGEVLVVGGVDADGRTVARVERFDPTRDAFDTIGELADARPLQAHALLAGDRLAWLACEPEAQCELQLLRVDDDRLTMLSRLDAQRSAALGLEGLEQVRLLGLPDGRLLVSGRSARGTVGLLLDPGRERAEPLRATRVAERLVLLDDDTVVVLTPDGASLQRHAVRSALHDIDGGELTWDGADRLAQRGDAVEALVDGARVGLSPARFADLRLELELEGTGRVLLQARGAPEVALRAREGTLALGDCEVERGGARLTLERRGPDVRIAAGEDVRHCAAPGLIDRIAVSVELDAGARLSTPTATRL